MEIDDDFHSSSGSFANDTVSTDTGSNDTVNTSAEEPPIHYIRDQPLRNNNMFTCFFKNTMSKRYGNLQNEAHFISHTFMLTMMTSYYYVRRQGHVDSL